MKSRMDNPVAVLPDAIEALHALGASAAGHGVPKSTVTLVHLRASQLNRCSVCIDMHAREMAKAGEPSARIHTVAGWRDAPYYSAAERAALELTEYLTRLGDLGSPVPDEVWDEAARHYDREAIAALLVAISTINVWNRLNVATRQVSGDWVDRYI